MRSESVTRSDLEDAFLDAALEERLRPAPPPDLTARILARAAGAAASPRDARGAWWAAAAVLAGVLCVGLALRWSRDDRIAAPRKAQDESPQQVRPASLEEFRKALARVERVELVVHEVGTGIPAKCACEGEIPRAWLAATSAQALLAALRGVGDVAGDSASGREIELRLMVDRVRYVEVQLGTGSLRIGGLPQAYVAGADVLAAFGDDLAAARRAAKEHQGIVTPEDLARDGFALAGEKARVHGLLPAHVPQLAAAVRRLRELDLRFSPALAADLRALAPLCAGLRKLTLPGLDAATLTSLGAFRSLEELRVLPASGGAAPWDRDLAAAAGGVGDDHVAGLVALAALRVLVLPGARLTPAGVARLARLDSLETLVLTGSPTITGAGFAAFAGHRALASLYLHACPRLAAPGIREIAGIASLEELYLFCQGDGSVARDGLSALTKLPALRRLELGGWFRGALTAADRKALGEVARVPTLQMLYLDACPGLTGDDLRVLHGATNLTMLVLAHHGLGDGFTAAADALLGTIPGLTVVTE